MAKKRPLKLKKQAKSSRSRRRPMRTLGLATLLWIVGIAVFAAWYVAQDEETQGEVQEKAISGLEWLRDRPETPKSTDEAITTLIGWIPASKGTVVTVADFGGAGKYALAGLPTGGRPVKVLENSGYVVGYDEEMRNPAWVAFKLAYNPRGKTVERPDGFSVDPRTVARVSQDDYSGTGYDRGHMAPNYAIGVVYGEQAQMETFLMSNIVPQEPELNRGPWREMEERIATDYLRADKELWIITGPVYNGKVRRLRSGVAIPDAFFLIVADVVEPNQIRLLAFIVPQSARDFSRMADYLVPVDEIETATGFDFMSLLDDTAENALEAAPAKRLW